MDYYLIFPSESDFTAISEPLSNLSIDIIGTVPESEGYLVNIRGELNDNQGELLAPFIIDTPTTPIRVWL
jgi:hypothetical protein